MRGVMQPGSSVERAAQSVAASLMPLLPLTSPTWAHPAECTFILLDTDYPDTPGTGSHGGAMCGDINLVRLPSWQHPQLLALAAHAVLLPLRCKLVTRHSGLRPCGEPSCQAEHTLRVPIPTIGSSGTTMKSQAA